MKNLIFTLIGIASLYSCEQDAFESGQSQFVSSNQSEINVSVAYLYWSETTCEPGSEIHPGQMVAGIPNARVDLFSVDPFAHDHSVQPIDDEITNSYGQAIFRNVDPGHYRLSVSTSFGDLSTTVSTNMNGRTSVDLWY
jgi:hypothetical protein